MEIHSLSKPFKDFYRILQILQTNAIIHNLVKVECIVLILEIPVWIKFETSGFKEGYFIFPFPNLTPPFYLLRNKSKLTWHFTLTSFPWFGPRKHSPQMYSLSPPCILFISPLSRQTLTEFISLVIFLQQSDLNLQSVADSSSHITRCLNPLGSQLCFLLISSHITCAKKRGKQQKHLFADALWNWITQTIECAAALFFFSDLCSYFITVQ